SPSEPPRSERPTPERRQRPSRRARRRECGRAPSLHYHLGVAVDGHGDLLMTGALRATRPARPIMITMPTGGRKATRATLSPGPDPDTIAASGPRLPTRPRRFS